jgi:hypothetical protein
MTDWELWTCANQIRKQHGLDGFTAIWERLTAFHKAEDWKGYRVWCEIAVRFAKLGPTVEPDEIRH